MINPWMFYNEVKRRISTATPKTTPDVVDQRSDFNQVDEFFHFTKGRFICNEAFEMSQRHVRFDMNELSRIAAKAAGFECCARVEKYPDGLYNKTFLFTMQDGTEVVGKVPNYNAGRPHCTIASEVATMDFARNVLKTPIPEVLTWSATAENSVGAEYIIMGKVEGIQLAEVWPSLDTGERFEVVKALARYHKRWMSSSFSGIGALYYAKDLQGSDSLECIYKDRDGREIKDARFAIGPCTARMFCDNGRMNVEFDRGPWTSVEDYRLAVGRRDIECIERLPQLPKSLSTLCGPGSYKPTREKKLSALETYLKLVKYVLPIDDSLGVSYLWHPDLHSENIFVDADDPTKIVSLIDWQSANLLPLFDHTRQLAILHYDGPEMSGLERPVLATDTDHLSLDERTQAIATYLDSSLVALYRTLVHGTNKPLYRAMEYCDSTSYKILLLAQDILVEGESLYQHYIASLKEAWTDLPEVRSRGNPPFPFDFSDEELAAIEKDAKAAGRGMAYMQLIREKVGEELWPDRGLVNHDKYEDSKAAIKKAKLELYNELGLNDEERAEWDERWPFDE